LEEMTHDEFIEKVINNEEDAKKHNDDIEEKIKQMTFEIGEALLEAAKIGKTYEITKKDYFNRTRIQFNLKKDKSFTIDVDINYESGEEKILFESNCRRYNSKDSDYEYVAMNAITVGTLYGVMLTNKDIQRLFKSKITEILLIELSKIDLGALRDKIRNAKEDALVHNLETHLEKNNVIEFEVENPDSSYNRYRRLDRFFQVTWMQRNRFIVKIEFEKNGLYSKNPIKIYDEEDRLVYESKSTKRDKILEIMRGCTPILKK